MLFYRKGKEMQMKSENQGAPGGSEVLTSWVILCTAQHVHPKSQEEQ